MISFFQVLFYISTYSSKTFIPKKVLEKTWWCGLGSVLGPLLFLIHTNDISRGSKIISSVLFADDTKVFYSHKSADTLCNTMNRELLKITSWFTSNKLSLNLKKMYDFEN